MGCSRTDESVNFKFCHKGLAAAALTELYRRTKASGATHMTGGAGGFYQKIGFQNAVKWTFWQNNKNGGAKNKNE